MVDIARYAFRLTAWNELAGVDDVFILLYFVKNDGTAEIEINSERRALSLCTTLFPPPPFFSHRRSLTHAHPSPPAFALCTLQTRS
jgi:hypothetical protein